MIRCNKNRPIASIALSPMQIIFRNGVDNGISISRESCGEGQRTIVTIVTLWIMWEED